MMLSTCVIGAFFAIIILTLATLTHDVLALRTRVQALEAGNEREDAVERKLQDQSKQLRRDIDQVALQNRAKLPDPMIPCMQRETLEGAFAPPRQPGDTRVWSPNEPKLPSYSIDDPKNRWSI